MKRLPYILLQMFFTILWLFMMQFLPEKQILKLIISAIFGIIMMSASAYRLENIGWMPGYALIYLIPIINIPLVYYCFHLPMNYVIDGKVDMAGKIIRIIFWVLFLFPLAGIIASVIVELSTL